MNKVRYLMAISKRFLLLGPVRIKIAIGTKRKSPPPMITEPHEIGLISYFSSKHGLKTSRSFSDEMHRLFVILSSLHGGRKRLL
jgi:hypothetical protein